MLTLIAEVFRVVDLDRSYAIDLHICGCRTVAVQRALRKAASHSPRLRRGYSDDKMMSIPVVESDPLILSDNPVDSSGPAAQLRYHISTISLAHSLLLLRQLLGCNEMLSNGQASSHGLSSLVGYATDEDDVGDDRTDENEAPNIKCGISVNAAPSQVWVLDYEQEPSVGLLRQWLKQNRINISHDIEVTNSAASGWGIRAIRTLPEYHVR